MEYIAHRNDDNTIFHTLSDHIHGVEEFSLSLCNFEVYDPILRLASLLHDMGKYSTEFQNYIRDKNGKRGSVKHAIWGAVLAYGMGQKQAALCICGHHAGIPNADKLAADFQEIMEDSVNTKHKKTLVDIAANFSKDMTFSSLDLCSIVKTVSLNNLPQREQDTVIRYLFSCLVDADWLDTERFMSPEKAVLRNNIDATLNIYQLLLKLTDEFISLQSKKQSPLNILRNQSRLYAVSKAKQPAGFFSLNLPTGLGKTLTSVQWALEHAKENNLKKIIIVFPFTNIIDQTAEKLKSLFGEDTILEHHASLIFEEHTDSDAETYKKQLACENWNYPIIVTTTIQFFESLFSNRPSKCRKVHNIANSVVIFDEVQSLEKTVVLATLHMLQDMQKILNISFLFCTATEPAFLQRENFDGIPKITPLTENPAELFEQTRRVTYEKVAELEPIEMDVLYRIICEQKQSALIVVNTKAKAKLIFDELKKTEHGFEKIYHLSTNMYPKHRKEIIRHIREDLQAKKIIALVSTQLIEAGVDIDFNAAFREIAPLSSIIQTAGRCNREGVMQNAAGKMCTGMVYIFNLQDGSCPRGQYETEKNHTLMVLKHDFSVLQRHDYFTEYYAHVMNLYMDKQELKKITDLREQHKFETVNDCYKIIDQNTEPIFIYANYKEKNTECTDFMNAIKGKIDGEVPLNKNDYRNLQQYAIQVYPNFMKKAFGHYTIWKNEFTEIKVWQSFYDEDIGIYLEENDMSNFVL